ncbi:MAG: DUF2163 domain-containing protein [Acetobacteraceae bacterium]|nr:DUF2163 domain-containing protein [Acetobacteraceae bacterium]
MSSLGGSRQITAALQASTQADATTLCGCVTVTPVVGSPLGFTEHTSDIVFSGVTYLSYPGVQATILAAQAGLAVDNLELNGAFDASGVTESDLLGGRYDGATFEIFLIDYTNTAGGKISLLTGQIGEVEAIQMAWKMELRSLGQIIQQVVGETTSSKCRAEAFDSRCKLNPAGNHPTLGIPYSYSGVTVNATPTSNALFTAVIPSDPGVPSNYFENAVLTWQTGLNAGLSVEVRIHTMAGAVHTITLVDQMRNPITQNDTFQVRFGCNKTFARCLYVQNVLNRRAEDWLPGTTEMLRIP